MSQVRSRFGAAGSNDSVAALRERVDNHSSMIRTLAEETSSQFRDFRAETSQQIGALAATTSQQITSVAAQVEKVSSKFDAYAASIADKQRPQYLGIIGAMVGAIGVTITIVGILSNLHDRPVDDKLSALTTAISDLTKNTQAALGDVAKASVSQSEYRLTTDFTNRMSDFKTQVANQRSDKMAAQIDKLDTDMVPRAELAFHWNAEKETDQRLDDAIRNLTSRLDMLAPAGDMLKRLTDRQHEIEMRVFGVKPLTPGS